MNKKVIITDSLVFFMSHFGQIVALCLPFIAVDALITGWAADWEATLPTHWWVPQVSTCASLLIYPLYTAALICFMHQRALHANLGHGEILALATRYYGRLLLVAVVSATVIGLGLYLLILPGVWIAVRLSLAEYYLVAGQQDVAACLKSSFENTRPRFWDILILFSFALSPRLALEIAAAPHMAGLLEHFLAGFAYHVLSSVSLLFADVVLFRVFMEIEIHGSLPLPPRH